MSCTKSVNHSRIKVEENKKKAIFINEEKSEFRVSQVDGCLIKHGIRCDNLVSKAGTASVLVELKGVDVGHACEQLFNSVTHENVQPLLESKVGFLIICSRSPRFDGFVIKAKQKAAKQFNAGFHVVTNQGEFDIVRVVAIDGPY